MDRKIEKKIWLPNRQQRFVLLGILILGLSSFLLLMGNSNTYRVNKDSLTIAKVINAPFQDYINVRAHVEPTYMAYLDAVEGGIVEKIAIEEGSMVKQGDTILQLSNLNLSLNILNSEAQLAEKANFLRETQISMEQQKLSLERDLLQLDYDLKRTERQYNHNQAFYEDQLISKDEFLASEEAYNLALKLKNLSLERQKQDSRFRKTQIRKIKQNLENMERNLELIYQRQDHLIVKAPVDGQLATLNAMPGQAIAAGYRLGQVNVLNNFKLQASIDEHYIDRVHQGLSAQLVRQDATFNLTVDKVYPEVSQGQFLVDLVFNDELPDKIRSGQGYNINIQLGDTKQAVLIGKGSFFQSTGGRWVYKLNEKGNEAVKHPISIGRQNPKYYEVLDGLKAGDKILLSSYELFGDNNKLLLN